MVMSDTLYALPQMISRANTHLERKYADPIYKFSPWLPLHRAGEKAIRDFRRVVDVIYQDVRPILILFNLRIQGLNRNKTYRDLLSDLVWWRGLPLNSLIPGTVNLLMMQR
jgi:hypothetical protein